VASNDHPAAAYIRFYETLTPAGLDALSSVVHEEILFRDPFNEVRGLAAYRGILASMFDAAPDISFAVKHCAYDGDVCYLRWDSTATVKALGRDPWVVQGMSELTFADDGRILAHIDFWDAASQFYERVPIVGGLIRLIRRRVAAH
jgi:steroid delta-isomerase